MLQYDIHVDGLHVFPRLVLLALFFAFVLFLLDDDVVVGIFSCRKGLNITSYNSVVRWRSLSSVGADL